MRMASVLGQEMTVTVVDDGYLLSFFEIVQPIISGQPTPEKLAAIAETGVMAECVSKVFIPKSKYQAVIGALISMLPPEETAKKTPVKKLKK